MRVSFFNTPIRFTALAQPMPKVFFSSHGDNFGLDNRPPQVIIKIKENPTPPARPLTESGGHFQIFDLNGPEEEAAAEQPEEKKA